MKIRVFYESPQIEVVNLQIEDAILSLSGEGVSLRGAGIDESDADENGGNVW